MRCSFLNLAGPLLLLIITITFSTPTNPNQHKEHINPHPIPVRSPEPPNSHAIPPIPSPDDSTSQPPPKRALLTLSNHPTPALLQRHNHVTNHLLHHARHHPLTTRTLASDLTFLGFRLIWHNADVIVSSTLAHYRTTAYYRNMTLLAGGEFSFGPTTQNFIITYGVFRLTFGVAGDSMAALAQELAREFPDGIGGFVRAFAEVMLGLTAALVLGTYGVLAWSVRAAVWITMVVVENAELPAMVTGLG